MPTGAHSRTSSEPRVRRDRVSLWHAAGTAAFHMPPDLHEHRTHIDMNKIMMAVLQAMQDERDRVAAEAEPAASPAETPT